THLGISTRVAFHFAIYGRVDSELHPASLQREQQCAAPRCCLAPRLRRGPRRWRNESDRGRTTGLRDLLPRHERQELRRVTRATGPRLSAFLSSPLTLPNKKTRGPSSPLVVSSRNLS